jgi:PIN domain nuclease of toxin-antitoxin system
MVYLDTHVLVWLFAGRTHLIPAPARAVIDGNDLLISPIAVLELQYLFESGKTLEPAEPVVQALGRELGLKRCDLSFADVIGVAVLEGWTRDPFDRITVAHARLRGAPLLTKDRSIHAHYAEAVWDEPLGGVAV